MTPLLPDKYYHIYNRANGSESIFKTPDNYIYFLKRYAYYINPIARTLCYCLMPNHFHFLVQIKCPKAENDRENFISKQFSNLFSSYTQAFNKQQKRKGSLFMKNFKRKEIETEIYLRKLIHYIHVNPVQAGFCESPLKYRCSSYQAILSKKPTQIEREEVINIFDDISNFIYIHRRSIEIDGMGGF